MGMVRVVQAETLDEDASLEKIEKAHAEALRVADLENLMSSNVDVPDARGTYSDYYEITSEVDDLIVYFRAKPKYERVHGYTSFMRVPHLGVWSAVSGMCKSTDLGDSAPNPTVIKGDYSCR
ncbi:hypothetical protein AM1_4263 [Acaryochloris marina MBIC11017]|uniref:Uncharacterized protein n=2 Tax=Acaryochloris marina TaxID=155978 RepID=B0CCT0_ACAM1|nr:hypothetical protein AM1_4263 [Acaryochloris marina MBIC11017]